MADSKIPPMQVILDTFIVKEKNCVIQDGHILAVRLNDYAPYETLDRPLRIESQCSMCGKERE